MKKQKNILNITYGINTKNPFKRVILYFKRLHFIKKYGFSITATWSFDCYFIELFKGVVNYWKKHEMSYPDELGSVEEWHKILDHMSELADKMNPFNAKYEEKLYGELSDDELRDKAYHQVNIERMNAKKEFFELFSKYFDHLWE